MSTKLLTLLLVVLAIPPVHGQTTLAVVVHPGSIAEDVSLDEVRRLYLGRSTIWANEAVRLYEFGPERAAFYASVLEMS